MLALGAHHNAGINSTWEWQVARELLHTCTTLYSRQPAGLGPERVAFVTPNAVRAARSERRRAARGWREDERGGDEEALSDDDEAEIVLPSTHDYDVQDSQWPLCVALSLCCSAVPCPRPNPAAYLPLPDCTRLLACLPQSAGVCGVTLHHAQIGSDGDRHGRS